MRKLIAQWQRAFKNKHFKTIIGARVGLKVWYRIQFNIGMTEPQLKIHNHYKNKYLILEKVHTCVEYLPDEPVLCWMLPTFSFVDIPLMSVS